MYSVFRCLMKMKVVQNLSEVLDDLSHNSTRNSSIFTFDNVSNISLDNRKKIYNEDEIDEIDEFITYEESQVRLIMKVKQNISEVLDDLSYNSTHNSSIFTFDNFSNISIENRKKEDNEDEIDEFITYEESQVRLFILGVISALILLTCATAFMLITIRVVGTYRDPIPEFVLEYKYKEQLGFPIPKLLFVDYSGHYVIYSPLFNTLEKLPNLKKIPSHRRSAHIDIMNEFVKEYERYKIFTAEYKDNLYFMYSDQLSNVIRYNLETKNHRVINEYDSSSINMQMTASSGIQIGKYFWIILGEEFGGAYDLRPQLQSSIWHLEKERWFEGPNLEDLPLGGISDRLSIPDYCIVSVGKNTAYILIDVYLMSYNFDDLQWTNHSGIPFWQPSTSFSFSFPTCAFFQDKMYRRYIYACGIAEYQDSILRWEILQYNLDTDAWISISKYSNTEKYAGLTTQFQGNLIQIFQSESFGNVEISKIVPLNYEQKILLSTNNSIEFDLFLEDQLQRFHTVSTFHARNYCKDYYLK